jgi:hypothetical protein
MHSSGDSFLERTATCFLLVTCLVYSSILKMKAVCVLWHAGELIPGLHDVASQNTSTVLFDGNIFTDYNNFSQILLLRCIITTPRISKGFFYRRGSQLTGRWNDFKKYHVVSTQSPVTLTCVSSPCTRAATATFLTTVSCWKSGRSFAGAPYNSTWSHWRAVLLPDQFVLSYEQLRLRRFVVSLHFPIKPLLVSLMLTSFHLSNHSVTPNWIMICYN